MHAYVNHHISPSDCSGVRPIATDDDAARWSVFRSVVESRRAVRNFDTSVTELPDQAINECLDMALLAPSSSNLQPWQFVRVKSPDIKRRLVDLCFGQPGAATATEFIVCLGRSDRWREFRDRMMAMMTELQLSYPKPFDRYYPTEVPIMYTVGPLGVVGLLKRVLTGLYRVFKPLPTIPCSHGDMKWWSLKNAALATMTLMLALAARGFASCPMDGHDKGRVRRLLGLPRGAHPLVVLAVGRAAPEDATIWGPRIRFPRELFVSEV